MATPIAAGLTGHSGTLTPEIWAAKTLVKFYMETVFGDIANTDYEGEIKAKGDTVHIRTIPDITIRDYEIGGGLIYDRYEATVIDLLIDKAKTYGISINDVERLQSDLAYVEDWTSDASQQLKIAIDTSVLSTVYSDADADNSGLTAGTKSGSVNLGVSGTPLAVDETNIISVLVDLGTVMDEQNLPEMNRWVVLSTLFANMIKKSELKDASLSGDGTSMLRNGKIGIIDNMPIHKSNNVTKVLDGAVYAHHCIFGHKSGLTFASQLVKNETLKNPNDFGDLMRGLQVYGFKVIKTDAFGHLYIYKG